MNHHDLEVPDLDLRRRPPMQSGEYPTLPNPVPRGRRSADNIAAVRPPSAPRPATPSAPQPSTMSANLAGFSFPPEGSSMPPSSSVSLELDRRGPVSAPGSIGTQHRAGDLEGRELEWICMTSLAAAGPGATGAEPSSSTAAAATANRPPASAVSAVSAATAATAAHSRAEPGRKPVDRRAALARLAGYGAPPSSILGTPAYALRVLSRRRVLIGNLQHARHYRLPDAEVYADALKSADAAAVRAGTIILLASVAAVVGLVVAFFA